MQGLQAFDDLLGLAVLSFGEELNGLVDGHLQQVVDVFATVFHIQHLLLEPLAVAGLALQGDVGHELHLNRDLSLSLALLATATLLVEREIGGVVAHLLSECLLGE